MYFVIENAVFLDNGGYYSREKLRPVSIFRIKFLLTFEKNFNKL